ncbi:hypothetical protein QBC35DRAFT_467103 [Podospora australis]|uniref:Uncharacterized protein n=1 Tax=Podospora australis TaxID=1536484 RepID=A0AAN6WKE9_9PEZI|nr:hypothetical protein QBC35DRAFT_467103 [Podospora australis]
MNCTLDQICPSGVGTPLFTASYITSILTFSLALVMSLTILLRHCRPSRNADADSELYHHLAIVSDTEKYITLLAFAYSETRNPPVFRSENHARRAYPCLCEL